MRGGHKAHVTTLIGQATELVNDDEVKFETLENLRDEILRQRNIIQDYNDKILLQITDDDDNDDGIAAEISSTSDFERHISATVKMLERKLDSQGVGSSSSATQISTVNSNSVKLPFVQLLEVSGDPLEWSRFWDLFKSSIHNRKDLSGATKFYYLVTQLKGEAQQLLAGFDHTDGEYEEAVKLLTQTYGKTQRLIQARLHAIFDLNPPSPTAKALGKFRSLYEGHLRGLKSLRANVEEAGYVFSELLIRKLPSRIRDNLNRANKSDFWTLEDLRAEIDVEIGHLQSVDVDSPSDELSPHASTAVFKSSDYIKLCQLCNENHFAINCTKYKTVDSKRARVSELKLCFNCLRGKHTANNCRTEGRCKKCSGKHHTSICRSNFNGYSAFRVQSKSHGNNNAFGNNSNVHGSCKSFGNSNLNSSNSNSYDGSCSGGNSNPNGGLQSYGNSNGNYGQSSVCGISGSNCGSYGTSSSSGNSVPNGCVHSGNSMVSKGINYSNGHHSNGSDHTNGIRGSNFSNSEFQSNGMCNSNGVNRAANCNTLPVNSSNITTMSSGTDILTTLNTNGTGSNTVSLLPTAVLSILINNTVTPVKSILDSGSQRTFILRSIVTKQNIPIVNSLTIAIDGFNSLGTVKTYDIANFNITTCDGLENIFAIVIDSFPSRITMPGRSNLVKQIQNEGKIKLADPTGNSDFLNDVGMLVGVDYFFKLLGASCIKDGVYAMDSRVGTIIGGSLGTSSISCNSVATVLRIDPHADVSLDDRLQKFWEMDSVPVESDKASDSVMDHLKQTITFENGRYEIALPWKIDHPPLPNNYYYAKNRLKSVLFKLRASEADLKFYDNIIKEQVKLVFVEEVPQIFPNTGNVHYLAHRGVKRDSATTPLRIVYDCSAKSGKDKPSLNECLYAGPNLINDLSSIILRFRLINYN